VFQQCLSYLLFPASALWLLAFPLLLQADIAHDHKAAQLEDGTNTLLGLDANRLCKWDLRDPRGVVQVSPAAAAAPAAARQSVGAEALCGSSG
jgi:hypothetical protein